MYIIRYKFIIIFLQFEMYIYNRENTLLVVNNNNSPYNSYMLLFVINFNWDFSK